MVEKNYYKKLFVCLEIVCPEVVRLEIVRLEIVCVTENCLFKHKEKRVVKVED